MRGFSLHFGAENVEEQLKELQPGCVHVDFSFFMLRVCLLMREKERSWKIVEGLETHREDRLIGINIFKARREICHFLFRVFILT